MRIASVCVVVLLAALAAARSPANKVRYDGHKLVTVQVDNLSQRELLEDLREGTHMELDFWTDPAVGKVDIHVKPEHEVEFFQLLADNKMGYTIESNNIQAHIDQEAASVKPFDATQDDSIFQSYPRHAAVNAWLETMASKYSSKASIVSIGRSLEGRDMKVMKICSSGRCGGKPAIFLDAGIHAREWITIPTILWTTNELLKGEDSEVAPLLEKYDIYVLPVANPDGYEYTHVGERLWRKTRSYDTLTGCYGADPNRNFDANFAGPGTSPFPCSDTYHGSSAFSEPCTANVRDFVNSIKDKMVLYIALHSYTQLWLTPWGFTGDYRPDDARELDRVAYMGAEAIQSVNGLKFTVGTPPQLLYEASGGAYDWVKLKAGVKYSYTLELRPDRSSSLGFVLDESNIAPSGREIFKGIKVTANAIRA